MRDRFLLSAELVAERVPTPHAYPFSIPAVARMGTLDLDASVTFLIGENGSGKSTLIEAIAVAAGFNAEGGSKNFGFSTTLGASVSPLHAALRLARGIRRSKTGYFLRAESFFNVATEIERLDAIPGAGAPITPSYGGPLHERSHGESFLALVLHRFRAQGLYILDEPEAALSPSRQLALLRRMHELVEEGSQFVVATHSPILLAFPGAAIHALDAEGIHRTPYQETAPYRLTKEFLNDPEAYLRRLLAPEPEGGPPPERGPLSRDAR